MENEGITQATSLCGYHSSREWLLFERFNDDELAELNAQNILSEGQHACVTSNKNNFQLPLFADRLMSRRELQKASGWSNDKFNRLVDDDLPVLIEGKAKHTYSAFQVYRWMLLSRDSELVANWHDADRFGDRERGRGGVLHNYEYQKIMPELFSHSDQAAA